jgi:ketosteroid isomerase-like protein
MKTIRVRAYRCAAISLIGSMGCVLMPSANAASAVNQPADVKAITAIEEDLATQTSMKALLKYYAPNAFVVDIFAPGIYKGKDQIYKAFERQLAPLQSMTHQMQDINIASDGRFACAAMQLHFDYTTKDGKSSQASVRQLDAFKKMNGNWRIIQQHISVPADAKTGMAVMNGPLAVRGPIKWTDDPIPGPAESPAQAKVAIRKWMDIGSLAIGIDQLMQYYGPADDVLLYDAFYPGELQGLQEIRSYYTALMSSYSGIQVKMPEFVVDSDGSLGVQIDTQDLKLAMNDGSTKYISLRQSDCLRRAHGKWYSFFEMLSYPVDINTGKSIMENPAAYQ